MKRFIMILVVYISFAACQLLIHETLVNEEYWLLLIAYLVSLPGNFVMNMLINKLEEKNG